MNVTARARTPEAAAGLAESMRRVIAQLDPNLAFTAASVPDFIERNFSDIRFIGQLLTGFAALGLFLAALGIYAVITRTVLQRTGEIGIRIALGAQWHDITRLIVGGGAKLAVTGAVVGLVLAALLTMLLTRAMPGLTGGSGVAVAGTTIVLLVVSLLASWLPARRATKVDPIVALRSE